jgi:hypothetical protein
MLTDADSRDRRKVEKILAAIIADWPTLRDFWGPTSSQIKKSGMHSATSAGLRL